MYLQLLVPFSCLLFSCYAEKLAVKPIAHSADLSSGDKGQFSNAYRTCDQ